MGARNYVRGFQLTLHEQALSLPLKWKKPQLIFVNSMSDLFHKDVPVEFIQRIFGVMREANWHTYQVLTKRAGRLVQLNQSIDWPKNVWMGVSVERKDNAWRIDRLRETGAAVKFVSFEPLLEALPELDLLDIDWAIVGGESGPKSRPMEESWVVDIRDQCIAAGVPFFFKQWGGRQKKAAGRLLEGRTYDEMPQAV